jgi:hypothetical protein
MLSWRDPSLILREGTSFNRLSPYYLGKGKTYEKGNCDTALYYAGLTGFDCLIDLESDEQSIGRATMNVH